MAVTASSPPHSVGYSKPRRLAQSQGNGIWALSLNENEVKNLQSSLVGHTELERV